MRWNGDVVTGLEKAQRERRDRSHAARRDDGALCPLESGDYFCDLGVIGVAVAGIEVVGKTAIAASKNCSLVEAAKVVAWTIGGTREPPRVMVAVDAFVPGRSFENPTGQCSWHNVRLAVVAGTPISVPTFVRS